MNKQAILHIQDSPYCFPVSGHEMILRLRTAKDDVKQVSVIYESKYVFAEKQRTAKLEKAYTDSLFDWYEVKLDLTDTRLVYVFKVSDGKEKYFFSEDGLTEKYDYKLGYYNSFQYPYINEADIVRPVEWMKEAVFYQIFVEHFNKGIKNKDCSYVNLKVGEKPTPKCFYGGDIPGITEKLPYLKKLGISAIYLTPVFKSPSNHKYDIVDYYEVDEHFGTNSNLKELVKKAHEKGIRIVLDAVFNHVSANSPLFQDVVKNGRKSKYYNFFVIDGDKPDPTKGNYEMFAMVKYMPKLNTSNPEVKKYLLDIAVHYIKEYDIDGWRLDVADEISQDFWRDFRTAVKGAKSDACIIGENWHDAYRNLRGDQHDGIMNYAFTKALLDFFAAGSIDAKGLSYRFNELILRNKDGVNRNMLNLLDSHDTSRFITMIKGDRKVMKEALAMLFFYIGTPCIYYGTEILLPGGPDPDCRRAMDFEKAGPDKEYGDIYSLITSLAKMRRTEHIADGTYRFSDKGDLFVMSCKTAKHEYRLVVNHSGKGKTYEGVKLSPESFVIMKDKGVFLYEED